MIDLLEHLKSNPFLLAPMAGITDTAFRSYMRELGCGVVTSELVSANGLQFGSERTRQLMAFSADQHPVGIQLFGENPEALALAARECETMGADFVDLNFGCPVPKVVKKGAGAALLKDLVATRNVFRAVKSSVQIPVTVKIRTGWDEQQKNAAEVAQVAYDEGLTWVTIHGRTRAQGYSGLADWNFIAEVKRQSKIPIIGSGDITNPQMACTRLIESGCDAVMIGRGCLKNPWIFQQSLAQLKDQAATDSSQRNFPALFSRLTHFLENNTDERLVPLHLKKLAAWYSHGYPESSQFRKNIFQLKSKPELLDSISTYFDNLATIAPADTSHEPFLMGGHG